MKIIQSHRPDLIKPNEDVFIIYNIKQSIRIGANSIAIEEGRNGTYIDLTKRWRNIENSGRQPGVSMCDHYTKIHG